MTGVQTCALPISDLKIIEANDLTADESYLTGESDAILKEINDEDLQRSRPQLLARDAPVARPVRIPPPARRERADRDRRPVVVDDDPHRPADIGVDDDENTFLSGRKTFCRSSARTDRESRPSSTVLQAY